MNSKATKTRKFTKILSENFIFPKDFVGRKLLSEYGAVFIAQGGVVVPPKVVFKNEGEVSRWQKNVPHSKELIGGIEIELQTPALKALKKAVSEAEANNLSITPRGFDAARRNYSGTIELWASRVNPGLSHWVKEEKLSESRAEKIRRLSPFEQVSEIFKLESDGLFFSKDLSKSIIYSVAPPGTSQHISMLALDVCEHADRQTRDILTKYQWFQTVISDLPHFTFLGASENELVNLGLKKVVIEDRNYWIPDI